MIQYFDLQPAFLIPSLLYACGFFALGIAIQWFLHRWVQRNLRRLMPLSTLRRWIAWSLTAVFILLNLPWIRVVSWWIKDGVNHPYLLGRAVDAMNFYMAFPFAIWQWNSLAVVGVVLIGGLASRVFRRLFKVYHKYFRHIKPSAAHSHTADNGQRTADNRQQTSDSESPAPSPQPLAPRIGRREFIQAASVALTASPLVASGYGAYVARESYHIEKIPLLYPGLPPELHGTTIVQLTDVHAGVFMDHRRMMEFVQVANGLNPDLIVLTGDYVPYSSSCVPVFVGAFRHLRARYGVYAILGNHDLFTGSVPALQEGLHKSNIRLLVNEQENILIRGARLNLMGITYIPQSRHEQFADLTFDRAMRGLEVKDTTILLSHQPNVFPLAAEHHIPLTLSGHTHGGQVKVEFLGQDLAPTRLTTDYNAGLFKIGGAQLYVSRGVGTSGPPIRLGSVPEITHITLL